MLIRVAERELRELLGCRRYLLAFAVQTLLLLALLPAFSSLLSEGGATVPVPALRGFIPVGVVDMSGDAELLLSQLSSREELSLRFYSAVPEEELRRGKIAGYLLVPPAYRESSGGGSVVLVLGNSLKAGMLQKAVEDSVTALRSELRGRAGAYPQIEVVRKFRREVVVQVEDRRYSSFFLGYLIPLVLFFPLFMTGGAVVDATTGEKLRRTLEPLLASPLSRGEIVAGKFLALWGFTGMQCTIWLGLVMLMDIPVAEPGSVLLVLLAAAASLTASGMLLGMLAKSVKEANLALMLLYIPAFIGVLYTLTAGFFTGFSPSVLPAAAVAQAVSGGTEAWKAVLPQLGIAALSLVTCRWVLGREEVLSGSRPSAVQLLREVALGGAEAGAGVKLGLLLAPFSFTTAMLLELLAAFTMLHLLPRTVALPLLVLLSALAEEMLKLLPVALFLRWRRASAGSVLACALSSAAGFSAIETALAIAGAALLGGSFSTVAAGRFLTLSMHLLATSVAALGLMRGGCLRPALISAAVLLHSAFNIMLLGAVLWV